eukprot:2129202-Rhodomonas_salina.2
MQGTHRLDGVRVDLARSLGREDGARDVLEDPQARELGRAVGSADDDVDVRDILEVSLGRDAVAEDVDPARHDGDRGRERRLHLHRRVAVVRRASRRGIDRIHDQIDKDLLAQIVARAAVKHLEPERHVERHKLVGHILRALAHEGGGPTVLANQPVELRLVAVVAARREPDRAARRLVDTADLLHVPGRVDVAHEGAGPGTHRVRRDQPAAFLVRLVLLPERKRHLNVARVALCVGPDRACPGLVVVGPCARRAREVRVLVQDRYQPHVDVLEERVLVLAVRRDREEARLLQVDRRLRRKRVERRDARRAEVGEPEEGVD